MSSSHACVNTVRPAHEGDLRSILALQHSLLSLPQWNQAAWRTMLTQDPSAGGTYLVSVAERDGEVAGYVASNLVAGESELEALAVARGHRRQGLGRALCKAWIAEAEALRATRLLLEVRLSNEAAIALYKSLGFNECGQRAAYYQSPIEDALLMERTLYAAE